MITYAIRHKETGKFLPVGKGSTWWEPRADYIEQPVIPRLFETKAGANSVVSHWYRGRAEPNVRSGGGWEEPVYDYVSGVTHSTPEIPREKGELEIVEFTLEELHAPQT